MNFLIIVCIKNTTREKYKQRLQIVIVKMAAIPAAAAVDRYTKEVMAVPRYLAVEIIEKLQSMLAYEQDKNRELSELVDLEPSYWAAAENFRGSCEMINQYKISIQLFQKRVEIIDEKRRLGILENGSEAGAPITNE